jgi:hypothetical protein
MCISCSLHYFIGCSLFGFKFECKFQFKFKSLLFLFSFSLSLSSFLGPAQLATSFLPFFSSPWQPSRGPLSFLSFSPRARPIGLFPGPSARPPVPRSFPALSLPGVWVLPDGPSFPAPDRDSAPSPAPSHDLRPPYPPRARTPRRPRPPLLKPPHPHALSTKPQPPRALTLAAAPAATAFAARASGRRRTAAPLLPTVARAIPKHRVVVRTSGRLSFSPLRLPRARPAPPSYPRRPSSSAASYSPRWPLATP